MRVLVTLLLGFTYFISSGQEDRSMMKSYPAMVSSGEFLGDIAPLRETPPRTDYIVGEPGKLYEKRNYFSGNEAKNPNALPKNGDPLAKKNQTHPDGSGPEIIPGLNFEGLHDPSGVFPPDPSGDVGKDHYMQMVNTNSGAWIQIWDKYTGNSVYGPAKSSTIWSQVSSSSLGDCIVQYDHDAERWIIMELRSINSNELLVAISNSSDPTGSWKAYRIQTLGFPDYPKLYVWHNAYFITVNELVGGNKCSGYALNRAQMISGANNIDIYRFEMPNFQGITFQPATGADWEGGPPPPTGSPEYIFRIYDDSWDGGQDHLDIWEAYVDWSNPSLSHVDGPSLLFPQPFETRVCFGGSFSFDCIEQPGTNTRIAALENTIMYRAPYRNFGDHESVVLNHITDVSNMVGNGGDAEVRWYELRKSGGGDWQIYQEGTHAPDLQTNRFMPNISIDEAGNIGLGYSGCSSTLYPGLYLTGHRKGDDLGVMTLEEYTLAAGGASHTSNRWGDYSSMTVDPYDGRTFWFTGEYQPDAVSVWGTRIGSFKVQRDTYDLKPEVLVSPQPSPFLGNSEMVKVRIINGGLVPSDKFTVSLYMENNFIVKDTVFAPIDAGSAAEHTFSQTVSMPTPGKFYKFRIITDWDKDQFVRNDTLDYEVEKITSNDAAIVGKYNLPGLVCGTETDFALILKNASGVPMSSARVDWRINTQQNQVYNWTGNLAPGEQDSIELHAVNINDGLNSLRAICSLPNGVQDEKINNDTLLVKFFGNNDGTYLTVESESDFGVLHWELRTLTNSVLAKGEVSASQPVAQICSDDNECYKVSLRANNFSWGGHFVLKDIFGKILVEITEAGTTEEIFTICTPQRQQIDVGPLSLESPVSGPGLTNAESITVQFRNFGYTPQSNISVGYQVNSGAWKNEVIPGPLGPGQTISHTFAGTEDLGQLGNAYSFTMTATVPSDENTSNDTSETVVLNSYIRELELISIDNSGACGDSSFALINILVKNNGLGDFHTFDVEYELNGVQQPNIPDNILTANQGESELVPLFITGLKNGTNTIVLNIANVNGEGPDEIPANDAQTSSFDINPNNQLIDITFSPDNNPQESTWDIVDSQGNILFSGGPYTEPMGINLENACLAKDSCYKFRIHDSGGNGMDNGFANLSINGMPVFEFTGQPFTNEYSQTFCVSALCSGFGMTANVTHVSGSGMNDGKIEAMTTGGTPPFSFILDNGNPQQSPIFSNLASGTYHLVVIDALGCAVEIDVSVGTVGSVEPGRQRKLQVSPNPTIGIAHLELPAFGNEKAANCDVFDMKGKLVQQTRLLRWDDGLHGNIALDKFPAGTYTIRVSGLDNVYVSRIIKK
ncbi:MAG: T9SS type A sorting domain-containing protein [Saprospiraceae bacterium]